MDVSTTKKLLEWACWFETADRRVAYTEVGPGYSVSTVFLGIDHSFLGQGPPILFEMAVIMNGKVEPQERCSTWLEAEEMHNKAVERCRQAYALAMRG